MTNKDRHKRCPSRRRSLLKFLLLKTRRTRKEKRSKEKRRKEKMRKEKTRQKGHHGIVDNWRGIS